MLVMLTVLVLCSIRGSILFLRTEDKRRTWENKPVGVKLIKAITAVSQSKMTAFFFFNSDQHMTPSAVLLTTHVPQHVQQDQS